MVRRQLGRGLAVLLTATLLGGSTLLFVIPASAEVALNRAVVQSLRNRVRLLLKNQPPRAARVKDALVPGDAVSTAQASLAELRFNDGSLARVGEQALFQFLANTRTFRLNNGTLLLLIPPGRGQTRVRTPNVVTGIRGSALFVRYLPDQDTTIVGALTTSGIEVSNRDLSQTQPLAAGQMAVVVKDRITQVYNFDLRQFYETSDLVQGLNLSRQEPNGLSDPELASVQAETYAGINAQPPMNPSSSLGNPLSLSQAIAAANRPLAPIDFVSTLPPTLLRPTEVLPPAAIVQVLPPAAVVQLVTQSSLPPGLDGIVRGVGNTIPGLGVGRAPGLTGAAPGLGINGPPGLTGTAPGLGISGPPGLTGTAPGLAGTAPGRGGSSPPGQAGVTPGQAGTNPGRSRQN